MNTSTTKHFHQKKSIIFDPKFRKNRIIQSATIFTRFEKIDVKMHTNTNMTVQLLKLFKMSNNDK